MVYNIDNDVFKSCIFYSLAKGIRFGEVNEKVLNDHRTLVCLTSYATAAKKIFQEKFLEQMDYRIIVAGEIA